MGRIRYGRIPTYSYSGKLRISHGIGARVVSRFRVILWGRLGMTVSDKACIAVIAVVEASPSTAWAAPPSSGGLVHFLFVPCFGHGQLQRNSGMASRTFIFLREGAPWVYTWVSRSRLVFVLHVGSIVSRGARLYRLRCLRYRSWLAV